MERRQGLGITWRFTGGRYQSIENVLGVIEKVKDVPIYIFR